jgi:glucoamylase
LPQTEVKAVKPYMLQLMLRNVATDGFTFVDPTTSSDRSPRLSRPGCILASPSYPATLVRTDQDYVYHWTRDGAIAAVEMATNPMFLTPAGVCQQLCAYVAFSQLCQASGTTAGHFYRAAYQIDGTVRDWSDQKDGPALQNIALVAALPRLDAASQATAKAIAQENLNRIVEDWDTDDADFFNAWEEVMGASFFARAAQLRCLQEIQSTNALGLVAPPGLVSAVTNLTDAIADHWDPTHGWYVSVLNGTLPADSLLSDLSGYDPNADVIMACIYGAVPCADPKLLATAAQLRAHFDVGGSSVYAIKHRRPQPQHRGGRTAHRPLPRRRLRRGRWPRSQPADQRTSMGHLYRQFRRALLPPCRELQRRGIGQLRREYRRILRPDRA